MKLFKEDYGNYRLVCLFRQVINVPKNPEISMPKTNKKKTKQLTSLEVTQLKVGMLNLRHEPTEM
jgi:hypothetical protein